MREDLKIFFVLSSYILLVVYIYNQIDFNLHLNSVGILNQKSKADNQKKILIWKSLNFTPHHGSNSDFVIENKCKDKRCRYVSRTAKNLENFADYDAVLLFGSDLQKNVSLPTERSSKQLYVFVHRSPPINSFFMNYEKDFNVTVTHRFDADVINPFGRIIDLKTNDIVAPSKSVKWREPEENFTDPELLRLAKNKTHDLMVVMSDCLTATSNRMELIEKLKKYVGFDVYGKCGDRKCDLKDYFCVSNMDKIYRFYAAFESSLCKDYVSENLFKALTLNIIPVVYGGADYQYFAPKKSYINVRDFKSIKDLVNYLNFLTEHPEEYIKYFWWKKYYSVEIIKIDFCKICDYLHTRQGSFVYKNLTRWWTDGICQHHPKIMD